MVQQFDLRGKTALVTGATSGIGTEVAAELAKRGAEVVLGVRSVEAGKKVAADIVARYPGAKVDVGPSLDLKSQASVRAFAEAINQRKGSLDILVNNAGLGYNKREFTEEGVGVLAQVNHLGPYTLTRLLERKLVASKARVVNVCSVTHRMTRLRDARAFLTDFKAGFYQHAKLANVYSAFEGQRRLGPLGVTFCAADPGAVRTAIYDNSPALGKGLANKMINAFYAPPEDGAQAVIHAATVIWDTEAPAFAKKAGAGGAAAGAAGKGAKGGGKPLVQPHEDLRYYARGVFTWPTVCNDWAIGGKSTAAQLKAKVWGAGTVALSFLDWPLRRWTGGRVAGASAACAPGSHAYDARVAADLWDVSAEFAKVPAKPLA